MAEFRSYSISKGMLTQIKGSKNILGLGIKFTRNNSTATQKLNWNEYFNLKKKSSRINTACSILSGGAGALATFGYVANYEIDPEKTVMGIEVTYVLLGIVIIGGGAGYLMGPLLGNPLFKATNKNALQGFKVKDRIFLDKIKSQRVDPSANSFSNPVPDYYGEKIFSLKDYRQWLRDGNAYRRKVKEFV